MLETLEPVDTVFGIRRTTSAWATTATGIGERGRVHGNLLRGWLHHFIYKARTVWFSYNAKWTFEVGRIVTEIVGQRPRDLETKPCVQTFTFGQHSHHDLGNNHRPLLRLRWSEAPLYPDAIRVPVGGRRTATSGLIPAGGCQAMWLTSTLR